MKRIVTVLLVMCLFTSSVFAASKETTTYTVHTTEILNAELSDLGQGCLADIPSIIEKDGKQYKAVSVSTDILKEKNRIEEKRTFSNTTKEQLPQTIKKNGVKLNLEIDSIDETVIVRDAVTGSYSWSACNEEPEIPETMLLTADNGLEVIGYLQNVESKQSKSLAEYELPATFIGDKDCQYYEFNGHQIQNTFAEPTFEGYEEEILSFLNLPADNYTITGGKWTSGYVKENGQTVRHAVFTCSADVLTDYTAYYAESLTAASPGYSTTDISAVYSNGIEDTEYDIAVTVDYEREGLPAKVIVMISVGIAILALLCVLILFVIKRKKKEEGEN